MDRDRWEKIGQIYEQVCEQPPTDRNAFLADACHGDEELRLELESLLRQRASQDGPIERVAEHVRTAWVCPASIGRYRIVRLIGEGGMGAVYEGEQDRPRRTVALKLLKSLLAAPELLRRFGRESEVLGRLQHPGIARVYEAGTAETDSGPQPYFAMEFIRGVSLLEYVKQNGATTRDCLELMIQICEAVDYAHGCGIIHRDLKPGNILVDQSGQPKILDFGVARLIDNDANLTLQTKVGDLVGTLAYMSPEQLLADPLQLDVRADVYSLGVVLFELLTGRRPYEVNRQWTDAARIIREQEPIRLGALNRAWGGDLETIVAKALEKDKTRRYASAAELAFDIRRFLADEPILARPTTKIYRGRKFVRRHRGLVSAAGIVVIVLLAGTTVSTTLALRARRERDRALRAEQVANAVTDFLRNDLLAQASSRVQADTRAAPDPDLKVRTALDRAAAHVADKFGSQPVVEASIRHTLGLTYYDLNLFPGAEEQLERAVALRQRLLGADHPDTLASMQALGVLYNYQGRYPQAEALLTQVLAARQRVLGKKHKDTLATMSGLALAVAYEGDPGRAAPIFAEVLEADRRFLGEENPVTLSALDDLAGAYRDLGRWTEAQVLLERELELDRRVLGQEHPDTVNSMLALAAVYRALGNYKAADPYFLSTIESLRRTEGDQHWETENARRNLALSYRAQGRYLEADSLLKQVLSSLQRGLGREHPLTLQVEYALGESYRQQRKYKEAESILNEVIKARRRVMGNDNPYTAQALGTLGEIKFEQHDYAAAERLLREAFQIRKQKTPNVWERYYTESMLGATLWAQGKNAETRPLLTEGYQGMNERLTSLPAEYRPALQRVHTWLSRDNADGSN